MIASHSSKRFRFVWTACIACVIVLLLGLYFYGPPIPAKVLPEFPWRTGVHGEAKHSSPSTGATVPVTTSPSHDQQETRDVIAVVVASRLSENTTWLDDALPDFEVVKYVTDDLDADLFVPVNKGHEAMVYLTYIVNNYHNLPSLVIFSHAQRYQWHNDDPLYDGARMLSRVQIPYLHQKGYTNLRCAWHWGCPAEIRPFEHGDDPAPTDPAAFILQDVKPYFYKHAFEAMFPGEPVPEVVGTGCCAQFAVSAERIRQRSIGDYQRVRRWIIRTELPDNVSGRIMEYIWHSMFVRLEFSSSTRDSSLTDFVQSCSTNPPYHARQPASVIVMSMANASSIARTTNRAMVNGKSRRTRRFPLGGQRSG